MDVDLPRSGHLVQCAQKYVEDIITLVRNTSMLCICILVMIIIHLNSKVALSIAQKDDFLPLPGFYLVRDMT